MNSSHVVSGMFHPTFLTTDRTRMAEWLERVLGVRSMYQHEFHPPGTSTLGSGYPSDYVLFSWIGDMWWYAADVSRWLPPSDGAGSRRSTDRLAEWAWKLSDAPGLLERCKTHGARLHDLDERPVTSLGEVSSMVSPDVQFMWTDPEQTGLAFELVNWPLGRPGYSAGWRYPPPSSKDPLGLVPPIPPRTGIEMLGPARHIVVTTDLARAEWVVVDLLGGVRMPSDNRIAHRGPRQAFALGGTHIEYITPDSLSSGEEAVATTSLFGHPQSDIYWAVSLQVKDLSRAVTHLKRRGVEVDVVDGCHVTRPTDCLGMRWGLHELAPDGTEVAIPMR